ncbi:MAG: hypothetical protein NTY60_11275 [Proteobacteria bacterium]|nr:hypothetical protein [Pseudomonadota bacterium]
MNTEKCKTLEVSDELLNAFVDDELDAAEKTRLLNCMASNAGARLRERISQIWQVRELVRSACPPQKVLLRPDRISLWKRHRHAMASGLVLSVAIIMGWFLHAGLRTAPGLHMAAGQTIEGRVILHLTSSDQEQFKVALNETEALSQSRDGRGNPVQVELLVDRGGLNLFRANTSPYAERIRTLGREHANISFLACNNTIEKLRKTGANVELLPHVAVVPSAKELIMAKVQQGWMYFKV